MITHKNIPIIILAAGASRRLGSPKQLVQYQGISLLRHTALEAIQSQMGAVHIITGAYPELADEISDLPCAIHYHKGWTDGMGSSIAFGVSQIEADAQAVIISTSDQPYITSTIYQQLDGSSSIMVSRYQEGAGPPSYFSSDFFDELRALTGDTGAKSIIRDHRDLVHYVDFPRGDVDIDTLEDVERLR